MGREYLIRLSSVLKWLPKCWWWFIRAFHANGICKD